MFPGGNELYEGVPSMSGRATGTDANGDTLSFGFIDANGAQVTSIVTPYGVMAMAPDGTYTYTIDNADPDTNGLALGETRTETFTVYVSDGRGGLTTQEITVTLTGTNDRPELSIANAAQGIHEDTASVGRHIRRGRIRTATAGRTRRSTLRAAATRPPPTAPALPTVPTPPQAARMPRSPRTTAS